MKGKVVKFGITFIDSKNRIWVCTPEGVIVADPIGQQFKRFSLESLNPTNIETLPRAIVEDFYPGYISLAGQYTDGIYHVNTSTGQMFKTKVNDNFKNKDYFSPRGMSQLLEGVDEEWMDPNRKRSFTYSHLPGGDYVFKIKSCNNEGVWNEEVYELPIHVGTPWYKTIAFWFVVIAGLIGLAYAYYRERINQIKKEARLKASFQKQVANLEMDALRAQMNPHFIFNCLSSIESYIIKNDTKKASAYLNNFSRLVRLILQNSRSSYVNLHDELEGLDLYLQLEQMRFRNSFSYEIVLKDKLNTENYEIPPMLIQPFVENSIWHGLNQGENGGKVTVEIQKVDETLKCVIQDNGIGRVAAAEIRESKKIKRKSMGMDITNERIQVINKIYNTNNEVEIEDLYDNQQQATGTKVTLIIPI